MRTVGYNLLKISLYTYFPLQIFSLNHFCCAAKSQPWPRLLV